MYTSLMYMYKHVSSCIMLYLCMLGYRSRLPGTECWRRLHRGQVPETGTEDLSLYKIVFLKETAQQHNFTWYLKGDESRPFPSQYRSVYSTYKPCGCRSSVARPFVAIRQSTRVTSFGQPACESSNSWPVRPHKIHWTYELPLLGLTVVGYISRIWLQWQNQPPSSKENSIPGLVCLHLTEPKMAEVGCLHCFAWAKLYSQWV